MFTASKLRMLVPQDCIFQHVHEPEAGPEGGIKKYHYCFFIGPIFSTKYLKFMTTASKLWMPGSQDQIIQHLLEPEAGPEAGIRRYQKL